MWAARRGVLCLPWQPPGRAVLSPGLGTADERMLHPCAGLLIDLRASEVHLFRLGAPQRHCVFVDGCRGRERLTLQFHFIFLKTLATALGLGQGFVVAMATAPSPT